MKRYLYLILIVLLAFEVSNAQEKNRYRMHNPRKKLAELEKIKLQEILSLDEKRMLTFFARRDEYNDKMEQLMKQREVTLEQMEKHFASDTDGKDEAYFKNLNNKLLNIEREQLKAREKYYSSLKSILSAEQISKVLLFERNFRREIRALLMRERKPK